MPAASPRTPNRRTLQKTTITLKRDNTSIPWGLHFHGASSEAQAHDHGVTLGVYISEVVDGSVAAKAGVPKLHQVTAVNKVDSSGFTCPEMKQEVGKAGLTLTIEVVENKDLERNSAKLLTEDVQKKRLLKKVQDISEVVIKIVSQANAGSGDTVIELSEWREACKNPELKEMLEDLLKEFPSLKGSEQLPFDRIFMKLHQPEEDPWGDLKIIQVVNGFRKGTLSARAFEPRGGSPPPPETITREESSISFPATSNLLNMSGADDPDPDPDTKQVWLHTEARPKKACANVGKKMDGKGYANGTFTVIPEADASNERIKDQYILCVMYNDKSTFHLLKAPRKGQAELFTSKVKTKENNIIPERVRGLTNVIKYLRRDPATTTTNVPWPVRLTTAITEDGTPVAPVPE